MKKHDCYIYSMEDIGDYLSIPRLLVTHKVYRSLSSEAKIIYSLFLERMRENGLQDEQNRNYIIYPEYELRELMNISEKTVRESLEELDKITGIGLIHRKKGVLDKPTRIYLLKYGQITPDFHGNQKNYQAGKVPTKEEYQAKLKLHEKKNSCKILDFASLGV